MNREENLINQAGYRLSRPRRLILDFLKKTNRPYSAQEINIKIKSINLSSVYRSLKVLEELNLVRADLINQEKKYCLNRDEHHHIFCTVCGHLETIPCTHSFSHIKNFSNINHQLTLSGICKKCSLR